MGLLSSPTGEGRFLANALSDYRTTLTPSAASQRRRVFRELNDELAGLGRKYADLASMIGRERAVELYLQGLVEHGIRPAQVASSSAITTIGIHDDRCATRQGHPCNCASAALTKGPKHN